MIVACSAGEINRHRESLLRENQQSLLFLILLAIVIQPWLNRLVLPASAEGWEYTITAPSDYDFEEAMNDLGEQGWQLVFARRARDSITDRMMYECILKRKK